MSPSRRRSRPAALCLYPGAGSSSDHPTLVALEEGLAPLPVHRADFPYRKEGRRAPDRAPKLIASIVEEAAALTDEIDVAPAAVAFGGRSMGGRMCSMAVADGLPAAALVLLSYPLHPPGKSEKLRTEHFGSLDLPCLFLAGTRDPFGTPEEIEREVAAIPGPVTLEWIDGGRHDVKGHDEEIVAIVGSWLSSLGPGRRGSGGRGHQG